MNLETRSHLSLVILAGFAMILSWLVVSQSVAAYLADVAPQTALWLNPYQPQALVNLADQLLSSENTVPSAANEAAVARALEQQPVNAADSKDGSSTTVAGREPEREEDAGATGGANADAAYSKILEDSFETISHARSVNLVEVYARAEGAVTNDPLNARAVRILAQVADAANNDTTALKLMEAAARISLHERVAVYWLMRRSALAGDYKAAIFYADAALRIDPDHVGKYAMPILTHFAEQKASSALIKSLLDENPPWRSQFLVEFPYNATDVRTPLYYLLALKTTPTPPTSDETRRFIDFLIGHRLYDLAYYTWLQFLPADELRTAGLLFNGGFKTVPSGIPFDWVITQGSGVAVDVVPRTDKAGQRALMVNFLYGRVDYHSVTELVRLAPGTYRFDGEYQGKIIGLRGLKWRLVCAGPSQTVIGESPMIIGATPAWKALSFVFTVPAVDCPAQYVKLDLDARMASEQLVTGSMLFGELRISRLTNPPSPSNSPGSVN